MNKKIWKYYVEFFHTKLEENYIIQSKYFDTIEEATNFVKMLDFVDNQVGVDLMICVGDEENYDILKLGHYQETPVDGLELEITNFDYYEGE